MMSPRGRRPASTDTFEVDLESAPLVSHAEHEREAEREREREHAKPSPIKAHAALSRLSVNSGGGGGGGGGGGSGRHASPAEGTTPTRSAKGGAALAGAAALQARGPRPPYNVV
jgi:hypothetical protein